MDKPAIVFSVICIVLILLGGCTAVTPPIPECNNNHYSGYYGCNYNSP